MHYIKRSKKCLVSLVQVMVGREKREKRNFYLLHMAFASAETESSENKLNVFFSQAYVERVAFMNHMYDSTTYFKICFLLFSISSCTFYLCLFRTDIDKIFTCIYPETYMNDFLLDLHNTNKLHMNMDKCSTRVD